MKKSFFKTAFKALNPTLFLSVFIFCLVASNIIVVAQAPGTNTPDDPNQESVGLPLPNRRSSSSSVSSTTISSSTTTVIPASANQVPAVPQNFATPETTVRSGGFSTFALFIMVVATIVGAGYYYKNNQKTTLKTQEKKIGRGEINFK